MRKAKFLRAGRPRPALLALADGTIYEGTNFGSEGETTGEVVFNTAMTGYQEILTDPSYRGQFVVMTYPEIGNYGVNEDDVESSKPHVQGFIVKEYWDRPSNFRSGGSLGRYLEKHGIVGIQGLDTRALVRRLRERGAMQGIISTEMLDPKTLAEKARALPSIVGVDLVRDVTTPTAFDWKGVLRTPPSAPSPSRGEGPQEFPSPSKGEGEGGDERQRSFNVVAFDYGIKWNILRMLASAGCRVRVVPASTSAEQVLEWKPDGIFLSNGPGDPEAVTYAIENVRKLLGKKPIFGICLGHQILGLAFGGKTFKLKYGHHGANHPVADLETGKIEITSQNHGFAVDPRTVGMTADNSLAKGLKITHLNLNDRTVEGMRHTELQVFSVQYHPEASPGPHDASYLFDRFLKMMDEGAAGHA
ncbi:MAG: glutamine-hydrolyzing carbamoyl-phosphate synthase small subunit [Nitrospirae bacterium]|nr:glutamine-hydrolyzing carbamoyl-phosphate synthase small subunit [Nitrospirota bacterium]